MDKKRELWIWRDPKEKESYILKSKHKLLKLVMETDYKQGGISMFRPEDVLLARTSDGAAKLFDFWIKYPDSPFKGCVISLDEYIRELEQQLTNAAFVEDARDYVEKVKALKLRRDGKSFVLERDNGPDISFNGEHLSFVSSEGKSRDPARWTELSLYRTKSGRFVCEEVGMTLQERERDRHRVEVVELEEDVQEFFGHGWLAKELYTEAGIEAVEFID